MVSLNNGLVDFDDQKLAANVFAQGGMIFFEETAASGKSFDDAEAFQFGIGFGDGVAVDAKLFRQRTDGGERFAGAEGAGSSGGLDLLDQLQVDREAGLEIDLQQHAPPSVL